MKWVNGIAERVNGDGSHAWVIRYRVPVMRNSKRTRVMVETLRNCKNRIQAQKVLDSRRADVFRAEWAPKTAKEPETVRSFAPTFLAAKRDLASVSHYRYQIEKLLIPFFDDKPLNDITPGDCTDYRLKRKDKKIAPATIRNELRCLQSLFAEARRRGLCDRDPVSALRFDDVDNARGRQLTDAEIGRLVIAARSMTNYMRPLFFTLYVTGCRLGEACALPWTAIDFDHGWLELKNKGKSNRRKRAMMNQLLRAELELWKLNAPKSEWVFPARNPENHRTVFTIIPHWEIMLERAKVTNLRRHDLRHNLVSRLRELGASDKHVMTQSGHSTLSMLNRYTHPEAEAVRELLDRLPGRKAR